MQTPTARVRPASRVWRVKLTSRKSGMGRRYASSEERSATPTNSSSGLLWGGKVMRLARPGSSQMTTSTKSNAPEGGMTMAEPTSLLMSGRLVRGSSSRSSTQENSETRFSASWSIADHFCQGKRQVGRNGENCKKQTSQNSNQDQGILPKLPRLGGWVGMAGRIKDQVRQKAAA